MRIAFRPPHTSSWEREDRMGRTAILAVGQYRCAVGNRDTNLSRIESLTREAAQQGAQLICFPELGTTGFAGAPLKELAEPIPGPTVERLGEITVHVFVMRVKRQLRAWPEREERRIRWVRPRRAADMVEEPELAVLLERIPKIASRLAA